MTILGASYLTDRQINVVLDGQESVLKTVNIGLPQGSVNAPWLFSLFINDMHRTSNKLNFIHFADNTESVVAATHCCGHCC